MRFPTGDVIVGWEVTVLSLFSRSTEWWVVKGFSCDLGLGLDPTEYILVERNRRRRRILIIKLLGFLDSGR